MELRKPAPLTVTLAALIAFTTSTSAEAAPSAPPMAQEVILTGWLHVVDYGFELTTVEAEVNGAVQYADVSRTGRFTLAVPANTEAILRFEHPGHLPKVVVVDTHFAGDGEVGQHTRHISFAVVLEPERFMAGQDYAGPVGSIGFDEGGGCAVIARERKLVPSRRLKPMVF